MKENALINSYPLFTLKIFILESNHTNSKKVTKCHVFFYRGVNSSLWCWLEFSVPSFYSVCVLLLSCSFFFCNMGCKMIGSHVAYSQSFHFVDFQQPNLFPPLQYIFEIFIPQDSQSLISYYLYSILHSLFMHLFTNGPSLAPGFYMYSYLNIQCKMFETETHI